MNNKIKIGVLGLGRIGRGGHGSELANCSDYYEIIAGCDYDHTRRENLPKAFENATIYTRLDDMLADPELEMITVCTRNVDHVPHAIAIMEAGKIAVVEKPIAVSYEQALELKIAAERYPGKIYLRHNRRFEPAFKHVRKIIKSGLLGDVYAIKVHRNPTANRRFDWQTSGACFGGLLNNWGPHLVDQALCLLNSPVKDVWCDLKHALSAGTADDYVRMLLRAESGCVVDVEISGNISIDSNLYYAEGTRGALVVPIEEKSIKLRYLDPEFKFCPLDSNLVNLEKLEYGGYEELPLIDEEIAVEPGSLADIWKDIYSAVRENVPFEVTLEQGIETVRISELARQSSGFVAQPIKAYY